MRISPTLRNGARLSLVFAAALCLCAQEPATQSKDARPKEAQGLPPRAAPTDYQAQAHTGTVTLAADFDRHAVPTAQGALSTEEFVVVELGLFGPPETRMQISLDDFSLRINGKKTLLHAQPYGLVQPTLKDPEWVPPESPAPKSKGGIKGSGGGGGGGDEGNGPPPEVKVPIEVQRAMAQRTQKAALPLGDRVLPQAGLIFFQHRGKPQNINSVKLIYSGSAGKATLPLQP